MPSLTARIILAATLLVPATGGASAQSVVDGSEAAVGADSTRQLLTLAAGKLHSPDARIAALRKGRAGALCGTVDSKNRMGTYTGPRGFVADLAENFIGRLPDPPELRNPTSLSNFQAMQRAMALYEKNCTVP